MVKFSVSDMVQGNWQYPDYRESVIGPLRCLIYSSLAEFAMNFPLALKTDLCLHG